MYYPQTEQSKKHALPQKKDSIHELTDAGITEAVEQSIFHWSEAIRGSVDSRHFAR